MDYSEKWLKADLKTALANARPPLCVAVGVWMPGGNKVIGLLEAHAVPHLIANYLLPDYYTFVTWDGVDFKSGKKEAFCPE